MREPAAAPQRSIWLRRPTTRACLWAAKDLQFGFHPSHIALCMRRHISVPLGLRPGVDAWFIFLHMTGAAAEHQIRGQRPLVHPSSSPPPASSAQLPHPSTPHRTHARTLGMNNGALRPSEWWHASSPDDARIHSETGYASSTSGNFNNVLKKENYSKINILGSGGSLKYEIADSANVNAHILAEINFLSSLNIFVYICKYTYIKKYITKTFFTVERYWRRQNICARRMLLCTDENHIIKHLIKDAFYVTLF